MGVNEFFRFINDCYPDCRQAVKSGAALEQVLRGKIVCIDIGQWQTRTAQIVEQRSHFHREHISEEQRIIYPLRELFFRIRNLLIRGGARYVIGVLDSSKAKSSKMVRGNIRSKGGICRRNRDGLNGRIIKLFKAMGFKCIRARDSVGEGEVRTKQTITTF